MQAQIECHSLRWMPVLIPASSLGGIYPPPLPPESQIPPPEKHPKSWKMHQIYLSYMWPPQNTESRSNTDGCSQWASCMWFMMWTNFADANNPIVTAFMTYWSRTWSVFPLLAYESTPIRRVSVERKFPSEISIISLSFACGRWKRMCLP